MNPRQQRRRTEDMPGDERGEPASVPVETRPAAEVPGPDRVPGAGSGTFTSAPAAIDPAAGADPVPYPELAPCYCAEAGTRNCPAHTNGADELVLVDDAELEEIRWHSYDEAVAAAKAHRDRSLEDARARLDKATHAAYADYGQAIDAVDETYDLARRAAMHAHELAGQASS